MGRQHSLETLRLHAVSHSLFKPTNLTSAMKKLGFVQADPIRSPAAAQDLILRHRVRGYRDGDLDRFYSSLELEEDFLYAYGFLQRDIRDLLYPRKMPSMSKLDQRVLDVVREFGPTHPSTLERHCGSERVVNAWGGYSKATKKSLEQLHYRGALRIARREKGVRVYEVAPNLVQSIPPDERCRRLAMVIANILSPAPLRTLQETVNRLRWSSPDIGSTKDALQHLFRTGELERVEIDGITYAFTTPQTKNKEVSDVVRILTPFDPIVWDRRRFEHLFGWVYRFEAYTPPPKRIRGYYAMPLLWRDRVIGWCNASFASKALDVEFGYVSKRPRESSFRNALDVEVGQLEEFLKGRKQLGEPQ